MRGRPSRGDRGASLIEALVALTVLGVALLLGLSLLFMERRLARRMEVHSEVLHLMENELETIRAAAGPPRGQDASVVPGGPAGLRFRVETENLAPSGLYRVTLIATYAVDGRVFSREIETLLWRPEP